MAILNDNHTIDLLTFCFGDAQAKNSMAQLNLVDVHLIFKLVTKSITGNGYVNSHEFWAIMGK